ncbi:glycosyltransferase family 2 protein [Klebsiella pneumoniae]|uniref:Glycosyltransferase family 2 protein n=1 Tax=Klebsiella pneumoniae TaxID=573 RepID=A0A939NQH2_KLEPN|nr:glycosyltransferase family 2 protein [Klebsiella pneumoniae]
MNYLKRCLNSIKEQTIRDIEIIVVDDNSNDDSFIYEIWCEKDTRIKYLRNDINRGACYSRNKAISVASSEYITGCDDDDY